MKDIPLGRLAHPSEFQGAAVWMASDASSYLNGSNIVSIFLSVGFMWKGVVNWDFDDMN